MDDYAQAQFKKLNKMAKELRVLNGFKIIIIK